MEAWKTQQLEEARQQEEQQQKEELARLRRELVIDWAARALPDPGSSLLCFLVELGRAIPHLPDSRVRGNSTLSHVHPENQPLLRHVIFFPPFFFFLFQVPAWNLSLFPVYSVSLAILSVGQCSTLSTISQCSKILHSS